MQKREFICFSIKLLPVLHVIIFIFFINAACTKLPQRLETLYDEGAYQQLIEEGEKYLSKKPGSTDASNVRKLVMEAEYQLAKEANTLKKYRAFEENYPDSPYRDEINERESKIYYHTVTLEKNTIIACNEFINLFPNSSYAKIAYELECQLAWNQVEKESKIIAYNKFMENYSNCMQVNLAQEKEVELAWKYASSRNTRKAYQDFRKSYPNSYYDLIALRFECQLAWNEAKKNNSLEAMEAFLKECPNTEYITDAKNTICSIAWKKVEKENEIIAYTRFCENYSSCMQVTFAQEKEVELAWKYASSSNTRKAYQNFRKSYPNSYYNLIALRFECQLGWNDAKMSNTIEAMEAFLKECPNSKYAEDAQNNVCSIAWNKVEKENNINKYRQFCNEYSMCEQAEIAKSKENKLAWERANSTNTHYAYQTFVNNYPDATQVAKAKEKLIMLEEKETLNHNYSEGFNNYKWGNSFTGVKKNTKRKFSTLSLEGIYLNGYSYRDKIAGIDCNVILYFYKNHLYKVYILFLYRSIHSDDYIEKFDFLEDVLSKKYGNYTSSDSCDNFPLYDCETTWETNESEIGLELYSHKFVYILGIYYDCINIIELVESAIAKEEEKTKKKFAEDL